MLAAVKTVTVTNEDGERETLFAGKTQCYVQEGHWLTRRYPHLFAPAGRAAPLRRSQPQPSAPAAEHETSRREWWKRLGLDANPAERQKWKPWIRFHDWAEPTFTIRLTSQAYRDMADQAYSERLTAYRRQAAVNETGGALFGIPAGERDIAATVSSCGDPGPRTRTSPGRIHVDCDHIRRQAVALERSGSPQRWVGHWHTHPDPDSSGKPSPRDLEFFAWDQREWWLQGRFDEHYVALIVTPRWDECPATCERFASWTRPNVHGWHMRAMTPDEPLSDLVDLDQFVVQPANVEVLK
jgi:hypothetical protein